jgi:hypothetical protein
MGHSCLEQNSVYSETSKIHVKVLLCADNSVVLMLQILGSKVITLFIHLIKEIQTILQTEGSLQFPENLDMVCFPETVESSPQLHGSFNKITF